ncbi:hypothetical protein GE061_018656 [Apolygus lucorum]|uniref:Small integral membrane protein 13 n=1 Tax=Apolygus lucorum TaxID=248454 RepID=A0A8S9XFU4_APOLU|nr:hypothetical protein GE061_018656 [Apolygus lucorum]
MEFLLAVLSVVASLIVVIVLVAIGWYLVWILFLSRFRFVRELIGWMQENSNNQDSPQLSAPKKPKRRRVD